MDIIYKKKYFTMYRNVPRSNSLLSYKLTLFREMPKSPIFICILSPFSTKNMFAGFKSLWTIFNLSCK